MDAVALKAALAPIEEHMATPSIGRAGSTVPAPQLCKALPLNLFSATVCGGTAYSPDKAASRSVSLGPKRHRATCRELMRGASPSMSGSLCLPPVVLCALSAWCVPPVSSHHAKTAPSRASTCHARRAGEAAHERAARGRATGVARTA